LLCMLWVTADLLWFLAEVTAIPVPGIPNIFETWGVPLIEVRAFTTAGVIVAVLVLLFRDQRQVTEERARFAGEVSAARSVQQYLIPEHLPATPGFAVESEYRPSREVGGDFFQVLPDETDGSLLIVIGDVAGKGVEAGMLATLIVGAVRTAASFTSDPARILTLLNERLAGRGLVTCLALRIQQDGNATLVNAGHLPPWLSGRELPVEGALPLGAVRGLHFPISSFTLQPGDTLLLMTDGVVEARDATGELFGFDRASAISSQSAESIAKAAQQHGQEDDITVLTVAFGPALWPATPVSAEPGAVPA
jgi:serine phosphatase RsbU (regulator of sigma subunit)